MINQKNKIILGIVFVSISTTILYLYILTTSTNQAQLLTEQSVTALEQSVETQITELGKQVSNLEEQVTTLEEMLTPKLSDVTASFGKVEQIRWSAFGEGERILTIEVDLQNTSNAKQNVSASDFVVAGSEGIPVSPVHLSRVSEQPRFKNGISLETNRIEIRDIEVLPNGQVKGVLAYFVGGNPQDSYLVTFNEQTTLLQVSQ